MDEKDRSGNPQGLTEWGSPLPRPFPSGQPRAAPPIFHRFPILKILSLYGPEGDSGESFLTDIGFPGQYPFTRESSPPCTGGAW